MSLALAMMMGACGGNDFLASFENAITDDYGNYYIDNSGGASRSGTARGGSYGLGINNDAPTIEGLDIGLGDFIVHAWVYTGGSLGGITIGDEGSPGWKIGTFTVSPGAYASCQVNDSDGTVLSYNTLGSASTGQWNHVALQRSGSFFEFFFNGNRLATGTSSSSNSIQSTDISLGGKSTSFVTGTIDLVHILKNPSWFFSSGGFSLNDTDLHYPAGTLN